MVESAIQDCLILLHIMALLPKVNTAPEVDFQESLSDWKSESVLLQPRSWGDCCNWRVGCRILKLCIIHGFDNEMYDIVD